MFCILHDSSIIAFKQKVLFAKIYNIKEGKKKQNEDRPVHVQVHLKFSPSLVV